MRLITTLLFALAIFLFLGCEKDSKDTKDNITQEKIEPQSSAKVKEPLSQEQKRDKEVLETIGITADNEKIIIEPKKTKEFLEKIATTLQKESIKIEKESKKIDSKDLGIQKEGTKIIIDINKTEKVLKNLTNQLENLANTLEQIFDK